MMSSPSSRPMPGFGFSEDEWCHMVTEWMGMFYVSIGMSDEWLAKQFSGDLTPEHLAELRGVWNSLVEDMPHLKGR